MLSLGGGEGTDGGAGGSIASMVSSKDGGA
jgi:hypothetical protein